MGEILYIRKWPTEIHDHQEKEKGKSTQKWPGQGGCLGTGIQDCCNKEKKQYLKKDGHQQGEKH